VAGYTPDATAPDILRHNSAGSVLDTRSYTLADSAAGRHFPDGRIVHCRQQPGAANQAVAANFLDNFPDSFQNNAAEMVSRADLRYSDL